MITWLYSFYVQFYCMFESLKIISSEFLFSIIIIWLVLFSTTILVQFPRGTIEKDTIEKDIFEKLYCIHKIY